MDTAMGEGLLAVSKSAIGKWMHVARFFTRIQQYVAWPKTAK